MVLLVTDDFFTARVVPMGVHASSTVLSTNIHLKFDATMEPCIAEFIVEVSTDSFQCHILSFNPIPPDDRMATISGLLPNTAYTARVVAVYKDGKRVSSELCAFTTPCKLSTYCMHLVPHPSLHCTYVLQLVHHHLVLPSAHSILGHPLLA